MNDLGLITQLSSKAHIKIKNKFTGFFNTPDSTKWILYAEHCTYRYFSITLEKENLDGLIKEAIKIFEDFELSIERQKEALKILNPDMDEYNIADLLGREIE